jgi:peroxiredoxin Q/BCP
MATVKKTANKGASKIKKTLPQVKSSKPFQNHTTTLKSGDKAPLFKGVDQDGKAISLTDYKGKKLVVYFYPKDDTPTCTVQACNFRDHFSLLQKAGIEVVGISGDSVDRHKKFEAKYNLPFRMIADEALTIIKSYDVWGPKQFMGKKFEGLVRTTFLINEKGVVDHIITKPNSKEHSKEILDLWK